MNNGYEFIITEFGADPTGKTDSTEAVQRAVDAAAQSGGKVIVPGGIFLCAGIKMKPFVTLEGCASYGYRTTGTSVLKLSGASDAECLIDLKGAESCTLRNLVLQGEESMDRCVHGIFLRNEFLGRENGIKSKNEDIPLIENVKVTGFSGDAIHLENVWCFRIRGCQMARSANGLYLRGVDGFILDCWFSANRGWGIVTDTDSYQNAAIIITGCRVEWNRKGGFFATAARNWQITANSFDRNFGPAVHLHSNHNRRLPYSNGITLTGNNFNRSGTGRTGRDNAHLILDEVFNVSVTGNSFTAGAEDDFTGEVSPKYAVVYKDTKSTVIQANVMQNSCTEAVFFRDKPAGNEENADPQKDCSSQRAEGAGCEIVTENNPGCTTAEACYAVKGRYFSAK